MMTKQDKHLIRGSGNVFRDLDLPNPEREQFRSVLAARIIKVLDKNGMTVRQAQEVTGTAHEKVMDSFVRAGEAC